METRVPPGDWVDVTEAVRIVAASGRPVSRRRVQALGKAGTVRSVTVLGRQLLDRPALVAWAKGPRAGGRPRAAQ